MVAENRATHLIDVLQLVNNLANHWFRSFRLDFVVPRLRFPSIPGRLAAVPATTTRLR